MYILGLNAYHGDSSACLIKDGKLVAALEEERIKRIKHWAGLPVGAIKFCLSQEGITLNEVDYIAIAKNPKAHLFNKIAYAARNIISPSVIFDRLKALKKSVDIAEYLSREFGIPADSIRKKIKRVEHHKAHLASAFFVSPYDKATVVSVDGLGDFVSAMWGLGDDKEIKIIDYVIFPHSLGFFYTALTQYLGFWNYGDEYKVMGLSAMGNPQKYFEKLKQLVSLEKGGKFRLNLNFFVHHKKKINLQWEGAPRVGKMFSSELEKMFGPARQENEPIDERFQDIAAAAQAVYEEAFFHILNSAFEETGNKTLCLAGGTVQNSLANGKIFRSTLFENVYIPPAAYDAGNAVGAAFYLWNSLLKKPRRFVMDSPYWGPEYSEEEIKNEISRWLKESVDILKIDNKDELAKKTAQALAEGKIVGWFQGRTEWGPRALGNRSILADPRRAEMKDVLNERIKKRESFRPFAPSILKEEVEEYFEETHPVPFMEKVYIIKPEKRKDIPAVTHTDGTGRLQTVEKTINPLYWSVINEFRKITGIPVVLNTSFNENEPIVNTPKEAIDTFLRTKMDVLVMGHYFISRR